jgi:hypothetical protein
VLLVALVATVISLVRARAPAPIRGAGRGGFLDTVWLGGYQGGKSERNSQLQRLRARPFFTRFG